MRITTKKGRNFAFKLRAIRNARTGQKKWFIGITTKEYFWLDLSTQHFSNAKLLAIILRDRLRIQTVYIFKTTKSYWLVTKRKLFGQDWDKEYQYWLRFAENVVCHAFCECCIRYHKATLRVSLKKGKKPQLAYVLSRLDGKSKPLTARVRDYLSLPRPRGSPSNRYPLALYKTNGRFVAKSRGLECLDSVRRGKPLPFMPTHSEQRLFTKN